MKTGVLLTEREVVAATMPRRRGCATSVVRVPVEVPYRLGEETDFEPLADAVRAALSECGAGGTAVTLVIPGGWCYSHDVELPSRRGGNRVAAYQLEEFLPEPLHGLTFAFARGRNTRAFGVAVRTSHLAPLIHGLADRGVTVEPITVDALCARAETSGIDDGPCRGVLLRDRHRAAAALYIGKDHPPRIVRTLPIPANVNTICIAEQIALTESACDLQPTVWNILDLHDDNACRSILARAVLNGRVPHLAVGALAPRRRRHDSARALTRTAAVLALFLTALFVQHWFAATRRAAFLKSARAQSAAIYRSVVTDGPMPAAPALRLASERLRLERLTTTHDATEAADPYVTGLSLLDALRSAVEALPDDLRIDVAEIAVDEQQMTFRGRITDHRQAERIAESIAGNGQWSVRPPRTSRLPGGGVDFTLRAVPARDHGHIRTVADAD